MVYQRKQIISESERNQIRNLYGLKPEKDFVFDLVITENEKYLIFLDNVFVKGGDGNSIGSIWENTHIFNEILIDSVKDLNESVQSSVNEFISSIKWSKDLVCEWIKDKKVLSEENGSWWDQVKSGAINLGQKVSSSLLSSMESIFKGAILPALRWIRRQLYTTAGIIIDILMSFFLVKSNAILWGIVVLLDIGEIAFNDFDPQDPARGQLPYFFLIADAIGALFSGLAAKAAAKEVQVIAKSGLSKGSPTMVKMINTLAEKIPSLKTILKNAANTVSKKLTNGKGVISKILGFVDSILTKFSAFLSKLTGKTNGKLNILKPAKTAAVALGVGKAAEYGVEHLDKNNTVGNFIVGTNDRVKGLVGPKQPTFNPEVSPAILRAKQLGLL
jgi:hypothetical protein